MRKKVLITGASSGIGYAFAKRFAAAGYELIISGRNQDSLQHLADEMIVLGTPVTIIAKDLSKPEQAFELYEATKEFCIDVLINNAGFGQYGYFHQTSLSKELDMITVNITSLTILMKLFISDMKMRNQGTVINISSTAAFQPVPLMNVYGATKSYVLSLTEAVACELKGTLVHIMAVCPGSTQTDFHRRANSERSSQKKHKPKLMNAQDVAEITYVAMLKKKNLVIPGFSNQLTAKAYRLLPRKALAAITKKMYQARKRT